MDTATNQTNPCFTCGQCCQHFRVSFYFGEVDSQPGGFVPEALVSELGPHRVCMKGTESGGAPCIALRYTQTEGYRCSIYENRPSPCRAFNPILEDGSLNPDCAKLRFGPLTQGRAPDKS